MGLWRKNCGDKKNNFLHLGLLIIKIYAGEKHDSFAYSLPERGYVRTWALRCGLIKPYFFWASPYAGWHKNGPEKDDPDRSLVRLCVK